MDLNIYTCMDLTGQSYIDVLYMPVKFFLDFIKWKIQIEDEKQKKINEITKEK